jgi:glyoxylase-like metal-dependent hydrolase (beta-lactamase superfamily II)
MGAEEIFFEQIRSAGCLSYMLGCAREKICVVIDPEIDKADDYAALAEFLRAKLAYAIDTHTHADHNSACKVMRERYGIKVVMHRAADAQGCLHAGAYRRLHVPAFQRPHLYRRYAIDRWLRPHGFARR